MPKIYTTDKFKTNIKGCIEDMNDSEEKYIFVANENVLDRSFVVVEPNYISNLMGRAGEKGASKFILETFLLVKKKISERYKDIRNRR